MIETKWGNFTDGETIAVVMYGPLGQEYVYKGTIVGKRESMGREYVIVVSEDGDSYDVSTNEAARILSGQAASEAISKSYTKRYKRIEDSCVDDVDREEPQYQENGFNSSKYNRI